MYSRQGPPTGKEQWGAPATHPRAHALISNTRATSRRRSWLERERRYFGKNYNGDGKGGRSEEQVSQGQSTKGNTYVQVHLFHDAKNVRLEETFLYKNKEAMIMNELFYST
ncbi:protein escargot-like isoform X1 [Vespula maculifrons]|uniref:Protein escargot-like isoform X1 n=1 Tax=Vespula maculifrons TaxID=7453 RepID=A0ABD2D0V6_VESMC